MPTCLLIRHATTAATRRSAFPATSGAAVADGCAPLDAGGLAAAAALGPHLPPADRVWSSFARRAGETATALGAAAEPDADLAECDFGRWAGCTPDEVHAADPAGLAAWYADPATAPHGGEGLAAVRARARRVLDRAGALGGTTVAVTHGGLVKAVLLEVLDLPDAAVWRLDADPASVTELRTAGPAWRVIRRNWTPRPAPRAPATAP